MRVAIVQARLGSSRLPGKVLLEIEGRPLLWHVYQRVKAASCIDRIIVATTAEPSDAPLREYIQRMGWEMFLGSESDVLDRFYQAARHTSAQVIVRITPDDPFKDPDIIDQAVQLLETSQPAVEYVSNCSYDGSIPSTFPEGIDIEAMTFECLERLWKEARMPSEREHLTPYLFTHKERFKIKGFQHPENLSHHRWTIDYEKDLLFARAVYARLFPKNPLFKMNDILGLLAAEPELSHINQGTRRYEGYLKSVAAETSIEK